MRSLQEIEQFLANFFRNEGIKPSVAGGEMYLGICSSQTQIKTADNRSTTFSVVVDKDHETEVVSLSRLAREIRCLTSEPK